MLARDLLRQINLMQKTKAKLRRTAPRDHRMVGDAAAEIDQPNLVFDEVGRQDMNPGTRLGQVTDYAIHAEVNTSVDQFSAEQNSGS